MHFATKAIYGGFDDAGSQFGEVSVPIYQTSTFLFVNADDGAAKFAGKKKGYIYTRMGNQTIKALEDCGASLENGFEGLGPASGMATVTTLYMTFLDNETFLE